MLQGIDVAHYQTVAQTKAAITAGARFVIVKASEGQKSGDAAHDAHVTAARAAGALVGHYHFAHPDQSASAETANFLARAKAQPGDLLVLDLEAHGTSWRQRLGYTLAWLTKVAQETKASPVLYINRSWAQGLRSAATASSWEQLIRYPLWIADPSAPTGQPRDVGWPVWTLHQYGIAGGIDRNVLNGNEATWAALALPAKTPVPHGGKVPGMSAPIPTRRFPVDTLLYARRGTPDYAAASWYVEAHGGDLAVTANLVAAKSALAAGARVYAIGGPACTDLPAAHHVNGKSALDTGRLLAALTL